MHYIEGIEIPLKAIINGELIFGPDISSENWAKLKKLQKKGSCVTMNCCHQPGFLRKTKGLQHFYHKTKHSSCSWKDKSPEHEHLKYQIFKICRSEGWDVEVECHSKDGDSLAIPDVLAKKDDQKIAFEIQLSKITLTDLEDRDKKFRKQQIESYWILKNYFNHPEVNYLDEIVKDNLLLITYDFVEDPNLTIKFENYYYICKKIRSIGIDPPFQTLYTTDEATIQLDDWVKNVLKGEYKDRLENRAKLFSQKTGCMKGALLALGQIRQLKLKLDKYKFKLDIHSKSTHNYNFKPELDAAYRCHCALDDIYRAIISEGNEFFSSPDKKIEFNLISRDQLDIIEQLLKKIPGWEEQMSDCLLDLEKKIIERSHRFTPQNTEIFLKKEDIGPKVWFQFIAVLPTLTIESSSGGKYQNPSGCLWQIDKRDATDFEERGLGKIVQ